MAKSVVQNALGGRNCQPSDSAFPDTFSPAELLEIRQKSEILVALSSIKLGNGWFPFTAAGAFSPHRTLNQIAIGGLLATREPFYQNEPFAFSAGVIPTSRERLQALADNLNKAVGCGKFQLDPASPSKSILTVAIPKNEHLSFIQRLEAANQKVAELIKQFNLPRSA